MMKNPQHIAAAVALASLTALSAAWISQYGFGLDPCQLCYYQRKPYMLNIALGIVAFFLLPKNRQAGMAVLFLCAGVFLADAVIAGFHVGVEHHWWKGLESCSNYAMPENGDIEALKKFIMSRNVVRCDVPAFVLFGISMAGYNFLLALSLAATTRYFSVKSWRAK